MVVQMYYRRPQDVYYFVYLAVVSCWTEMALLLYKHYYFVDRDR